MLNIQLFLEGEEIELNDSISFPITKTFSHISNPTDILVEYSKTINVPATNKNNIIMAHAYRLDRQFVKNTGGNNIGIMLDPLKRIPMKLVYNGDVILDGYAKYTSSTVNSKQTYYTFNLYGTLGDIFQKLLDCVVDENMLNEDQLAEDDGGLKYVIPTMWEERVIDGNFIKESWNHKDVEFNAFTNPHNCVGFAPAYRGLYDNFESTSIFGLGWNTGDALPTEPESFESRLKARWVKNLVSIGIAEETAKSRVDSLDYGSIVPLGLNEHQLRQFRSYEQKPYIYMPALMKLFEMKWSDLTDYKLELDSSWFNTNNPYYANLCYMLDYLSVGGNKLQSSNAIFTNATSNVFTSTDIRPAYSKLYTSFTHKIFDSDITNDGSISLDQYTIGIQNKRLLGLNMNPSKCKIVLNKDTSLLVTMTIYSGKNTIVRRFWGSTGDLGVDVSIPPRVYDPATGTSYYPYNADNFVKMYEDTRYDKDTDSVIGTGYLTIPKFIIPHVKGESLSIKYDVTLNCQTSPAGIPLCAEYFYDGNHYVDVLISPNNENGMVVVPDTTYKVDWRDTTKCSLKNIYTKESPLFGIVLQYTKMMGLIWKVDYNNKQITLQTRSSYFKDYNIVDWNDKIDKSKGMTIEPISFDSKFVTFNYNDTDGGHYSNYRDKYGVNFGEKKIRTNYNFDTKENKLFKESTHTSIISLKSIPSLNDLITWNTMVKLPTTASEIEYIDCEDDKGEKSISMNNWYFRLNNHTAKSNYAITDVSPFEKDSGKYFWVDNKISEEYGLVKYTNVIPQFSPVYKSNVDGNVYGCLFNCPMEDYTRNGSLSNALGHYIYDICWSDFINERYNANNKKLTCYVKIRPEEFSKFNVNTFVLIDNQLFCVNKIIDFDVKNNTTKVELIQVTDINGYTNVSFAFPEILINTNKIYLDTTGTDSAFIEINTRSYPPVTDSDINIRPITVGSNRSTLYVASSVNIGSTTLIRLNYASNGAYNERWDLQINKFNKSYTIPIYINNDLAIS